jgi:hypothetical protein
MSLTCRHAEPMLAWEAVRTVWPGSAVGKALALRRMTDQIGASSQEVPWLTFADVSFAFRAVSMGCFWWRIGVVWTCWGLGALFGETP